MSDDERASWERGPVRIGVGYGVRGVRVARLRATAGDFTWSSVMQHIDDCDVLVFDMTPTKRVEGTDVLGTTPNVWLELGYALHTGKPVYVVHESEKGHHDLPSDLKGLVVGRIANEEGKTDTSLRMSLVSTVRKLLLASLKSSFHTNKEGKRSRRRLQLIDHAR